MDTNIPYKPKPYNPVSKLLHWLIAVMIIAMLILGFYMTGLPLSPYKLKIYSWHKWMGISILLLSFVRVLWRLKYPAPDLPPQISLQASKMALAGHAALYALTFAVPLSGWLMSSAKGVQTVWFGVMPLPDLIPKDEQIGDLLLSAHINLNFLLIALIIGHALMALKHQFIDKDGTLMRMLPSFNKKDLT